MLGGTRDGESVHGDGGCWNLILPAAAQGRIEGNHLPGQALIPYVQIYDMQIDQTTQNPSLDVTFALKQNGNVLEEFKATPANSEQFFYGHRVVLLGMIPLKHTTPGKYSLEIKVHDTIGNRTVTTSTDFKVLEPPAQKLLAATP